MKINGNMEQLNVDTKHQDHTSFKRQMVENIAGIVNT